MEEKPFDKVFRIIVAARHELPVFSAGHTKVMFGKEQFRPQALKMKMQKISGREGLSCVRGAGFLRSKKTEGLSLSYNPSVTLRVPPSLAQGRLTGGGVPLHFHLSIQFCILHSEFCIKEEPRRARLFFSLSSSYRGGIQPLSLSSRGTP